MLWLNTGKNRLEVFISFFSFFFAVTDTWRWIFSQHEHLNKTKENQSCLSPSLMYSKCKCCLETYQWWTQWEILQSIHPSNKSRFEICCYNFHESRHIDVSQVLLLRLRLIVMTEVMWPSSSRSYLLGLWADTFPRTRGSSSAFTWRLQAQPTRWPLLLRKPTWKCHKLRMLNLM